MPRRFGTLQLAERKEACKASEIKVSKLIYKILSVTVEMVLQWELQLTQFWNF